jgi:hypothetical protein
MSLTVSTSKYKADRMRILHALTHLFTDSNSNSNVVCLTVYFRKMDESVVISCIYIFDCIIKGNGRDMEPNT